MTGNPGGPITLAKSAHPGPILLANDKHLVPCAGLVPVMTLATQTGLSELLDGKIRIAEPRIKSGSANPSPKLVTLIAGMCAGADCIDDLDVVRSAG